MTVRVSDNRVVRGVYLAAGLLCLALGVIGLFLPIMPTTVFILLAAFFFARSSERLHSWIVGHPQFGPLISDYQAGLGIPMYAKVWAVGAVGISFGLSTFLFVSKAVGKVAMIMLAAFVIWYIASRPTKRPAPGGAGLDDSRV